IIKIEHIFRGRPADPFFYSEIRMSYGKPFTLYKFNIFKYERILEARSRGEFIHTKEYEHNGGVIKSGWILKQIYMDELPQFFSVLKGDLSLIGPRPVNLEVYERLMIAGIVDKNRVPGGITGNYQSHKETVGASSSGLDREYADYYHSQPWYKLMIFDFKIILRTLKVILLARGI
ncbi:MAG: sugar transferase, partial [Candidatus Pacebacteria bacterium]|nr:sugar transferase [Candidatus Paceibacterota bacterium]